MKHALLNDFGVFFSSGVFGKQKYHFDYGINAVITAEMVSMTLYSPPPQKKIGPTTQDKKGKLNVSFSVLTR